MMEIKILGSGCKNCTTLTKVVEEVLGELNMEATVEKVTDFQDILGYGVMKTPGLVVNGTVKFAGRIPSKDEVKKVLEG
ncbi:redox-active disulfide protein 2 [Alkaliphilus metalliredigens QYMF]|uniref:Redox-active disulfide protein 2 n=2 Tax=Alkaliphilus TaxID=114627 RepID=A6TMM1_ALKMQ|nr:redox-active disulfide protein 2 [Alkaliphilus metalliredigens QYMF]